MQLPPPVAEQAPAQQGEATAVAEQAPSGTEAGGLKQPPATLPALPAMPQQNDDQSGSAQPPITPAAASPVQSSDLPAAQDTDLIEKEWVHKAKAIVEQTKEDPYKQSEALTMFKADYMKKRYNKTIKLG